MHAGTRFTADDLGAAAQRLVDTGYFDDVTASLEGRVAAVTVNFTLKPTPRENMLHVGFQNFVWLNHEEIEAAIKAQSPLFLDYLPEASPVRDVLKVALTQALAAKGINATVVYETMEPSLRHPVRDIEFRISTPFLRVTNIKLTGVSPELVPYVQKAVNATAHTPYIEAPPGVSTADFILSPLLDAGYIQAALSDLATTPSPAQDGTVGVVVSARLDAGDIYHVSGISFAGASLVSADSFAVTAKLHPGDIASRAALLETLAPLDAAYRRQGYMDITVVAKPRFDMVKHEVAYAVSFSPAEQYHVKDLVANNLDPAAEADFDRLFLMKSGELYNPEYVQNFLTKKAPSTALAAYTGNYTAFAHPVTHTVDLAISFVRRSM